MSEFLRKSNRSSRLRGEARRDAVSSAARLDAAAANFSGVSPRRRRRRIILNRISPVCLLLASLVLCSLVALSRAQMSSTWLGTKDLGTVMEGKPPAAPAPPPPPPPPPPMTTVASSSAAPRDSRTAILPAAGAPTTTLALIPVGDGSFAAVPVALASPAFSQPVTPNSEYGFGFGAASALSSSPATPAVPPTPPPSPPTAISSAAPPRTLVGVSRADDEAPDPINVPVLRPPGVASRAGRQAPSVGGGGRGMPGGFAAPREAEPGVVISSVAPPPATFAPRTAPAPVFTGVEPVASASASASAAASSTAPAFSTSSSTMAASSATIAAPAAAAAVSPLSPIPTAPGLADTLSQGSLAAMASNKPPRAAVQPPPGVLVGGMVIGDDGRPYLPADLEEAAAASGALRGAGIPATGDTAGVTEGFAAPADAMVATTARASLAVRPFAVPNTDGAASIAAPAAAAAADDASPAPVPDPSKAAATTASAAAPAPAPASSTSSSSSNSSSSSSKGFDCVAAALKLIAPTNGKALCPTGDLRESQASLIARARCSMLVDQVLARPAPSGQCCSALRDFTKNGCSCNADVAAEATKLGFSSTMLFATARVAQVACGRGTVFNSCDQSFGC